MQLASLRVPLPTIPDVAKAEYVNDNSLCMNCHENQVVEQHAQTFQNNVHRDVSCEKCHGPASLHLASRGKEPNTMLNFKKMTPPQRSELCLQCHEEKQCEADNRGELRCMPTKAWPAPIVTLRTTTRRH